MSDQAPDPKEVSTFLAGAIEALSKVAHSAASEVSEILERMEDAPEAGLASEFICDLIDDHTLADQLSLRCIIGHAANAGVEGALDLYKEKFGDPHPTPEERMAN